jgi:predicted porin
MQKKLIVLALASAFAAPAFAATSNVDIYGQLTLSYDYINTGTSIAGEDKKLSRVSSNASRIGFKGSEDLGGGLAAIWQIENQLDMDGGINNLSITTSSAAPGVPAGTGTLGGGSFSASLRNTFVGLKGGFGTALIGKHDTPYKLATASLDIFADTAADYNNIIGNFQGINAFDLRPGNVMAYITPVFSGLSGAIAYVAGNELGNGSTGNSNAWSAMGVYSNGPIFASLAYEKHNDVPTPFFTADDRAWKLGAGYTFGNAKVGLIYEDMKLEDTVGAAELKRKAWYLNGMYTMGNIDLKAAFGSAGDTKTNVGTVPDSGAKTYSIGADYNMSKRTKVYALYTKTKNDTNADYGVGAGQGSAYVPDNNTSGTTGNSGDDPSVFSIGIRHSF